MRWNAAKAFLRPIEQRDNLQVWTGAQVSRVLLERGDGGLRAVGVEVAAARRRRAAARAARAAAR